MHHPIDIFPAVRLGLQLESGHSGHLGTGQRQLLTYAVTGQIVERECQPLPILFANAVRAKQPIGVGQEF